MLIGIPTAAIVVPAVLTWARDLNASARRTRQLDEQNKVVSFWENWLRVVASTEPSVKPRHADAEKSLSSLKEEVRSELARAGSDALFIYNADKRQVLVEKRYAARFAAHRASLSWFRRAFLLYRAPNAQSRYFKILFWVNNAMLPAVFLLQTLGTRMGIHKRSGSSPWANRVTHLDLVIILGLIFLYWLGASAFHRWKSVQAERWSHYI